MMKKRWAVRAAVQMGSKRGGNLAFIKIPESIAADFSGFTVNPEIPVPVEMGDAEDSLESLDWKMLASGMLRFLAMNPGHEHGDYYRDFVFAIKGDIAEELSSAGIAQAEAGELPLAEEIFLAIAGLLPEACEPVFNLAVLYGDWSHKLAGSGRDEEADEYNQKAFDAWKRYFSFKDFNREAYYNAAFFYLKNRSHQKALEYFELYRIHGKDRKKLGKAKEAITKLAEMAEEDEDFKAAYDLVRMGREEEGIKKILIFCEKHPDSANAWFILGWAYRRTGRFEEASGAFLKALELGQREADLFNELAICEMELGLFKESRKHLEEALRIEPENVKIISNLGVLAAKTGRNDEAAGFFRTVLELFPEDLLAKSWLEGQGLT